MNMCSMMLKHAETIFQVTGKCQNVSTTPNTRGVFLGSATSIWLVVEPSPQNQLWGYMGIIIPNRKQQMFQTTKKFLAPFELVSLDPQDYAFGGHLPSEPAQLNWCHDLPVGSMFLGDSMLLAMSHVAEGVTWCHLSQIVSKERMWIRVSSPWLPDFHIQNSHPGFHPGFDPSSTHSRALIPTV